MLRAFGSLSLTELSVAFLIREAANMPEAAMPQKRVLEDVTNSSQAAVKSSDAMKKRKVDARELSSQQRRLFGANRPQKSHFEAEVLEKLSQDINDLKGKNSEKDQQWERPPLEAFDEKTQNMCFQQVDAEEGTIFGGETAIRLFGVSEVSQTFRLSS